MKVIYERNVSYFVVLNFGSIVDSSGVFLSWHFRNFRWHKHTTTTTFIDKYRFLKVENRCNKICCSKAKVRLGLTTSQS